LHENQKISIGDLQQKLNLSTDSLNQDLKNLEEKGLLKRTTHGAELNDQVRVHPPLKSTAKNEDERDDGRDIYYNAIAKRAAEYIKENDTVYICAASVGYLMTRYLPEDIRFTAVTNSIIVAEELMHRDNIETFVIGGKLRSRGYMADALSIETVRNMRFDIEFMSAIGFSANFGLSNTINESGRFQRAVIESSRKNICLVPHHKLGFEGFAKVADAKQFDIVITDWEALEDQISEIRQCGVDVVVVDKPVNH
jgi:DeoR family transcriptional regulator, fructose operon transcriptional repressor